MVYSYCRKLDKTEKKNKQSIDKWASKNQITIDEYVWDEEVSQKTPFEKRSLSSYLIPKLQKGDCLVVYQLSCLGRSAEELDYLFNQVFLEKKVRILCKTMNIDIDFSCINPVQQGLLDNFAFAANLHRTLVVEVTKSALSARRNSGIKLGGASDKWKEKYNNLSKEERHQLQLKRGLAKHKHCLETPDVQAFLNILKKVFNLDDDYSKWDWNKVTTSGGYLSLLIKKINEANEQHGLFATWDLSDLNSDKLKQKIRNKIHTRKRAFNNYYSKYDDKHIIPSNTSEGIVFTDTESTSQKETTKKRETELDKNRLKEIEEDTLSSQDILSDIFTDDDTSHDLTITNEEAMIKILKTLLSKDVWSYQEVEHICKKHKLIMGAVLEQINDYSYNKVDDVVLEDDGEKIYVTTEYKDFLL